MTATPGIDKVFESFRPLFGQSSMRFRERSTSARARELLSCLDGQSVPRVFSSKRRQRDEVPLLYDNEDQFRFYARWRYRLERHLSKSQWTRWLKQVRTTRARNFCIARVLPQTAVQLVKVLI